MFDDYYSVISDWMRYHKYQAIYNYPQIYNTLNSNPETIDIILFVFCFWLLDNILVRPFLSKARWFVLHTFANAFVVYSVIDDLYYLLLNPIMAFNRVPDYNALNLTVALHFYHAVFFKNLQFIDWVHHILMMGVAILSYGCPPAVIIATNGLLFFLNGLPGGIDYLLLTLVKYKIIHPLREKELNSYLNVWIRSPGTLIGAHNMYLTTIYANYYPSFYVKVLIMVILVWNAQYFTNRVVGNYYTKLTMKRMEFEEREGHPMMPNHANKCVGEEIDVINAMSDIEEENPLVKIIGNSGFESEYEE